MSSALTTLEHVRSPRLFYGHISVAPDTRRSDARLPTADVGQTDSAFGIFHIRDMLQSLTLPATPSTDDEAIHVTKEPASIATLDVRHLQLVVQSVYRALAGATSNPESNMLLLTAGAHAALGVPGVLLGEAWPHHLRLLRGRDAVNFRSERFSAADFSDLPEVDRDTVNRAVACLNLLPGQIPRPQASPSPDGEIGLFWFHNNNRVEAYFDHEGHLTWIGKFDGHFDRGGDVDWRGFLPSAFMGMLTSLYS